MSTVTNVLPAVSSVELKQQTNDNNPNFLLTITFDSSIEGQQIQVNSTNANGLSYSIESGSNVNSIVNVNTLTHMFDSSILKAEIGHDFYVVDNVSLSDVGKKSPFRGVVKSAGHGDPE